MIFEFLAQKEAIQAYTLAELLCDTVPEIARGPGIQPNAFFFPQDDLYVVHSLEPCYSSDMHSTVLLLFQALPRSASIEPASAMPSHSTFLQRRSDFPEPPTKQRLINRLNIHRHIPENRMPTDANLKLFLALEFCKTVKR